MITFPDKHEVIDTIKHQHFFYKLSKEDVKARQVSNKEQYLYKYIDGVKDFTPREKIIITSLVNEIQPLLSPYGKLANVPWKFAKIDQSLENGYPHTLQDIIFLPENVFHIYDKNTLRKTILHEQIHVYQRKYPIETNVLICRFWGYDIQGFLSELPKGRSNPDLNGLVYCKKGRISYQKYNSTNPSSLADSTIVGFDNYEHPYEKMAYIIPDIIIDKKNDDNTRKWMTTYL